MPNPGARFPRLYHDVATGARWARTAPYLAEIALTGHSPDRIFGRASDKEWFWLHAVGRSRSALLGRYLPGLPDPEVQIRFTGSAGLQTLREAANFYVVTRDAFGPPTPGARALDFGCGWGRITRFFIKDFAPGHLVGIDPLPEAVDLARATNRWAEFRQSALLPPVDLPTASLDLIFAFSVFSHLTEEVHLRWLDEFGRLLRPGGRLVVTTRKRSFIEDCDRIRRTDRRGPANVGAFIAFTDTAEWLRRYDAGEFCNDPVGGGDGLPEATYGETCIPAAYVQQRWPATFALVDFVDQPARLNQNVIVARRTNMAAPGA